MAIIQKKSWPAVFRLVKSGRKRFEVRVADFSVKPNDTFALREWDPKAKRYTGRTLRKKVKFVYQFKLNDFGQKKKIEKKGLYVIQF